MPPCSSGKGANDPEDQTNHIPARLGAPRYRFGGAPGKPGQPILAYTSAGIHLGKSGVTSNPSPKGVANGQASRSAGLAKPKGAPGFHVWQRT